MEGFRSCGINSAVLSSSPAYLHWPAQAFPGIVSANRYPMDRNAFVRPSQIGTVALHQHEYSGEIRLGLRKFALSPGDITITPPRTPFSYHLPHDGEHLCIHFMLPRRSRKLVQLPLHIRLGGLASHAREKINSIISTHRRAYGGGSVGFLADQMMGAALQELLLWLALQRTRRGRTKRSKVHSSLQHLLAIIDSRFGEMLTIPGLADEVNISQDYLTKIFRQNFGGTISRYLLRRRIDVARHLLLTTAHPVRIIAARVGLPDAQYFNKQFRRIVGTSPSEMRLQASPQTAREISKPEKTLSQLRAIRIRRPDK